MTSAAAPRGGDGAGGVSVVIPAFNEAAGIEATLADVRTALHELPPRWKEWELLVVDDGSTDDTAERARRAGAEVIALPENRGYGAALKAGIARARHDVIVITDADGTYPAHEIPRLLERADAYDLYGTAVGF